MVGHHDRRGPGGPGTRCWRDPTRPPRHAGHRRRAPPGRAAVTAGRSSRAASRRSATCARLGRWCGERHGVQARGAARGLRRARPADCGRDHGLRDAQCGHGHPARRPARHSSPGMPTRAVPPGRRHVRPRTARPVRPTTCLGHGRGPRRVRRYAVPLTSSTDDAGCATHRHHSQDAGVVRRRAQADREDPRPRATQPRRTTVSARPTDGRRGGRGPRPQTAGARTTRRATRRPPRPASAAGSRPRATGRLPATPRAGPARSGRAGRSPGGPPRPPQRRTRWPGQGRAGQRRGTRRTAPGWRTAPRPRRRRPRRLLPEASAGAVPAHGRQCPPWAHHRAGGPLSWDGEISQRPPGPGSRFPMAPDGPTRVGHVEHRSPSGRRGGC